MLKSRAYFFKTLSLSLALFIEALLLTSLFFNTIISGNIVSFDWNVLVYSSLLLLSIGYTYALTVGAWDTWLQFVIVPLPVSLANALIIARINYFYAALVFFSIYLFMSYNIFFSTRLKEMLIKFDPKIILRVSTKSLFFVFAVMAGTIMFLSPIGLEELKIVDIVANMVDKQANAVLGKTIDESAELRFLEQMGLINVDFKAMAEEQINTFIEPYKHYLAPILAIFVIGTLHFLNSFVYMAFIISIDLIYFMAKRSGFLKTEYKEVTQEVLTF